MAQLKLAPDKLKLQRIADEKGGNKDRYRGVFLKILVTDSSLDFSLDSSLEFWLESAFRNAVFELALPANA